QLDRQVADFSRLAVAPDRLADRPDAGAADQHALLTVSLARPGETGIHRRFVRNVDLAGDAADLLGDRPAPLLVEVEQRDFRAFGRKRPGARLAEARSPSGDHGR